MISVPDAIVCRDLRKAYVSAGETTDVLRGLDLTVPSGVLVAIVGPSGSGKSTFLRLLAGIDAFDDGELAGEVHGGDRRAGDAGRVEVHFVQSAAGCGEQGVREVPVQHVVRLAGEPPV